MVAFFWQQKIVGVLDRSLHLALGAREKHVLRGSASQLQLGAKLHPSQHGALDLHADKGGEKRSSGCTQGPDALGIGHAHVLPRDVRFGVATGFVGILLRSHRADHRHKMLQRPQYRLLQRDGALRAAAAGPLQPKDDLAGVGLPAQQLHVPAVRLHGGPHAVQQHLLDFRLHASARRRGAWRSRLLRSCAGAALRRHITQHRLHLWGQHVPTRAAGARNRHPGLRRGGTGGDEDVANSVELQEPSPRTPQHHDHARGGRLLRPLELPNIWVRRLQTAPLGSRGARE
mmetsp:Transcript_129228/g.414284  ORF Transcript_129228/g.414284 Transcript_129228/m.414284 type:complete len:287 (+) Transcript_129228:98-958(+)